MLSARGKKPMFRALARMFGRPRQQRSEEIQDAVLGTLRLAEEGWWEGSVSIGGKTLGIKIGGDLAPDAALMEHARTIVRSFPEFETMIAEFLENEARRMPKAADEIRQLTIEDVMLCWPKCPNDGMIYFKGPDQYRVWRCDYIARKPKGLGFDDWPKSSMRLQSSSLRTT
jgi:hypothetical protein